MWYRLFILGIFLTTLNACVPAAFVAGATAGGAIIYDNRNVKTIAEDKETTLRAQTQIAQDPQLQGTHISVTCFNHIVLLVGQAQTSDQAQRAFDIVSNLPNIKRIYNEISIGIPTTNTQRAQDAWITTKVKTLMLAEKGLHSTQIKVITEDNVVYLLGLVTRTQGSLAATVASKAEGVQKVVKLFEYLN